MRILLFPLPDGANRSEPAAKLSDSLQTLDSMLRLTVL